MTTVADVYAFPTRPETWWSTSNFGEAAPGVLTPLSWSFWGPAGERATRRSFAQFGALAPHEVPLPDDPYERLFGLFLGRFAGKVDFLGRMGDRLPGTTGAAVAEQILGRLPDDFASQPTRHRYPAIAFRLPRAFVTSPGAVRVQAGRTAEWWTRETARSGSLDLAGATAQWAHAVATYEDVMTVHITTVFAVVQPIHDQLAKLAVAAGSEDLAGRAVAGQGSHAELAVVEDLWKLSRGRATMAEFLAAHGYHGPNEGELEGLMWREDPAPIESLVGQYAAKDDSGSPEAIAAQRADDRRRAQAELVAALPRSKRPGARLVLGLADSRIPLRGIGKASFLQTIDVARAAARRVGVLLAESGATEQPGDVFYLSAEELSAADASRDYSEVVAERRAQREAWQGLIVPNSWQGAPPVVPAPVAGTADRSGLVVQGLGACPGVVEGRVRVVSDPTYEDVEPGEILVAPFTDPSWASVMFTSAALVVDIGGLLSHAAVVARELGVPCVMGTQDGTRALRTGDVCRVDGHAGTVELLTPVPEEVHAP